MEPKLDQFIFPTYSDLWDYHVEQHAAKKPNDVLLRYKFLFCNGILSYDDKSEVNARCCKLLEFQSISFKEDGTFCQMMYICRNCKFQARLKAQKIATQQKWTGSDHRTITFKDYEFNEYGNETVAGAMFVKLPFGSVHKLVEVIDGPNCFYTTEVMTGDEKALYYLKGLVPDKLLKVK